MPDAKRRSGKDAMQAAPSVAAEPTVVPAGRRGHQPTHPGAVLREDVLPALGLPVLRAAEALGVSRQALHAILAERAGVTPEMAVRLAKLCGNGPGLWLRMQQARDLWQAEQALAETIAVIPTLRVPAASASPGSLGRWPRRSKEC